MKRYKSMTNKAKKGVSEALVVNANVAFTDMKNCPNGMF